MSRKRRVFIVATAAAFLAIVVAADRASAATVERRLADRLRCATGAPKKPEVAVDGYPMLSKLVAHRFGLVVVTAHDIPLAGTTITGLHARAWAVRPGPGGTFRVGSMTIKATVPFAFLTQAGLTDAAPPPLPPELGAAGPPPGVQTWQSAPPGVRILGADGMGRLMLQTDLEVRGQKRPATVFADLRLDGNRDDGNRLVLRYVEIELPATGPPAGRIPLIDPEPRSFDLPALPAGLDYHAVAATPDGLRFLAGGYDLYVTTGSCAHGRR